MTIGKHIAKARLTEKGQLFVQKRMKDFDAGKMYGGRRRTYKVTNPKQAQAIAYSEAKSKGMIKR